MKVAYKKSKYTDCLAELLKHNKLNKELLESCAELRDAVKRPSVAELLALKDKLRISGTIGPHCTWPATHAHSPYIRCALE